MNKEKYNSKILDPTCRHEFVYLFDATDANPNGDPDAGNLPRVDPETMQGEVTDVCLKHKVRNYVDIAYGTEKDKKIYIQNEKALNTLHERAYEATKLKSTGSKQKAEDVRKVRDWMCKNFYDIRTFGAVMNTEVNCGQVRGPVQLTFARSIDRVVPQEHAIIRMAVTKPEDLEVVVSEDGKSSGKLNEMARKSVVPYGLYKCYGFITPHYAEISGFNSNDMAILWEALENMFDMDRSAAKGFMAFRGLYIFSHDNKLGRAPAHKLLNRVKVKLKEGIKVPREFSNYEITVNKTDLPEGVTLTVIK